MARYRIIVKDKNSGNIVGEFVKIADTSKELPRLYALLDVAEELIGKRNIFAFATKFNHTVEEI